ncbi:hypothetical protein Bca4012_026247 [Brassica carinata]
MKKKKAKKSKFPASKSHTSKSSPPAKSPDVASDLNDTISSVSVVVSDAHADFPVEVAAQPPLEVTVLVLSSAGSPSDQIVIVDRSFLR